MSELGIGYYKSLARMRMSEIKTLQQKLIASEAARVKAESGDAYNAKVIFEQHNQITELETRCKELEKDNKLFLDANIELKGKIDSLRHGLEFSELSLKVLSAKLEKAIEQYKNLAMTCEWYSNKGTEQERHHFLTVEAVGNFEADLQYINAITLESLKEK